MKFVYIMMRGEIYHPPPAPPKKPEKTRHKRSAAPPKPVMADLLPPDDLGASSTAVDAFGFGLSVHTHEVEETAKDQPYV